MIIWYKCQLVHYFVGDGRENSSCNNPKDPFSYLCYQLLTINMIKIIIITHKRRHKELLFHSFCINRLAQSLLTNEFFFN